MGVNQLSAQFIGCNCTGAGEGIIMCMRERERESETLMVGFWSLPCRFAPLTMFGWGTPHVCRIRVWEILAESISWATDSETGKAFLFTSNILCLSEQSLSKPLSCSALCVQLFNITVKFQFDWLIASHCRVYMWHIIATSVFSLVTTAELDNYTTGHLRHRVSLLYVFGIIVLIIFI